ncbi:MAG: hypothetical protein IIV55_00425 [Alistipes sp.]|nr:hypothetical protein [Alistipes sp.]
MTTYLKHIFALVAALVFAGCDLLGDLDFLPGKPDGGDDAPTEEAFRSVRGDFDGFDELVYNDDTIICYRESDAGLPEAMFIFTNDGGEEVAEMVYFDGDGIPVYFNVNGESIYVENIRGELCDLVILSDDGTFSTIPDVATGFDIANYWSEHPATRADGSNVANGVNMANRVLGARYFAQGSFGMGLSAYSMLLGCAMLVPGCNVVVGATLMIGSAVGFVASSMQIARATDLLVSDGSHTDGAYIATAEVLGIISNVIGTPVVAAANTLIDSGFNAVYDELDRRAQELERLKQSRSVQSLTLTTGSADVDYCNRSARLTGSLSSTLSSDDRVGILLSEDPSGLHVVDCYDTGASAGEFEFEFSDLERCKSYFYRSYYVSESEQRNYVSKCREFYVPGVKTAGYTQLSEGRYEVILEAMLGDKLESADVGICYSSDNSEPTIEDDYTDPCEVSRTDSYTFTIECEELPCYYRAFMIVDEGIIYGATRNIYADDRDILVKFYEDTSGDNWKYNTNWCSDLPLRDWYGVETNDEGRVVELHLSNNNLTGGGSLSGLDALECLYCWENQLTTLDVSGCTALEELYCFDNQLTRLDVSGCTSLEGLLCAINQLTMLDVSGCTALESLSCGSNQLTTLDVSGCAALWTLDCGSNQLTTLDVSGLTALEELYCYHNQLTTLDVSGYTSLGSLECPNNQLTTLDVSGCTALDILSCEENQLTTLDVSGCTALRELDCYNNQLTTLDVSDYTALWTLSCRSNKITREISGIFAELYYFSYDQRYTNYWRDNDGNLHWTDHGVGWWWPGEPHSGPHD